MEGSACSFIPASITREALAPLDSLPDGKRELEPLKSETRRLGIPANILVDKKVKNDVEIHRHEADLWIGIEGVVEFEAGGVALDPWIKRKPGGVMNDKELKAEGVEGGERYTVRAGDILYIPAGVPHRHGAAEAGRLWIIKIPAREEVSLESFPGVRIVDVDA